MQTRNRRLFTPGFRLWRAPKPAQFRLGGRERLTRRVAPGRRPPSPTEATFTSSAYSFHTQAGYTFNTRGCRGSRFNSSIKPAGDSANPSTFTRFDTLFGARRWEYGPTSLYGAVQRSNLISPAVRLEVTPSSGLRDAFITYRSLFLAKATDSFATTGYAYGTGRSGNFAGQQIETRLRYRIIPDAMLLDTGITT